jgi:hypothetical protein
VGPMIVQPRRCAPSPRRGEGWGEGVTRAAHGSEPPHPFLHVATESSPLPDGGEGTSGDSVSSVSGFAASMQTRCAPSSRRGEGWGEGVTGRTDGSEPPHPILHVATASSPLPDGGEGTSGDCALAVSGFAASMQTRCAPSPRRGEGWGEGVRTYRETITPQPTPLPAEVGFIRLRPLQKCRTRVNPSSVGEGAHRVCGQVVGPHNKCGSPFSDSGC